MGNVRYDDSVLRSSIDKIKELTGKDNQTVLKEVSLNVAKKCVQYTPPKTKSQGGKAVEADINRLFIDQDRLIAWGDARGFKGVAKRLTNVLRREDFDAAQAIFRNCPQLRNVEVTAFTPELHTKNRDSRGRVTARRPRYFFTNPKDVKKYIKQEKKKVGYAKASFAGWVRYFGGSVPQWIGRFANTAVDDKSTAKLIPRITMISVVAYIQSLNDRNNIVQRAIDNGANNMVARAKYLLKESKKKAGFK